MPCQSMPNQLASSSSSLAGTVLRRHSNSLAAAAAPRLPAPVTVAREPLRMRNLRGGAEQNSAVASATGNGVAVPGPSKTLYRGNLSGPGPNVTPATAVQPDDVLAASQAADAQAAAAIASASKPVVKFVPKSVSLFDAFKFNGPAPEVIQGRLAMVGFLAGAVREARTGETLLQQASQLEPGTLFWLALIVVASLQPITRAAKSEAFGWFTPRAETTNGRAAMLGFAVVAALEWNAGVCFF